MRDRVDETGMKKAPLPAHLRGPIQIGSSDLIRVYRRHAARAISEERWPTAAIFLDRILEVDPRNTEAWLMKGAVAQHCVDDERTAIDCYQRVITLCGYDERHPHVRRARRSLGRIVSAYI